MAIPTRRALLASTAVAVLLGPSVGRSREIKGSLPWLDGQTDAPTQVGYGPWRFFNPDEVAAVEAMVDRLIPPDPETPGGKDAGCAVFIDRQLAGPYGDFQDYYMKGPFQKGAKTQGDQSPVTPSQRYRTTLAAIDRHCRAAFNDTPFAKLTAQQQDELLKQMEGGKLELQGANAKTFFSMLLIDTQQGFFADPIYGGNRDMVGWKMIGYPGARYDYREWVERHNERFPLPPIGIKDHPDWG